MFELSIAWKYLLPRRRQLSVSIISLISICVIALVVWLVVLFFSITNGMERHWISKLIAVTAPVRVTPTDAYYQSYYYQVDGLSAASNYTHKSLGQKRHSAVTDPYDPLQDEQIPQEWNHAHLNPDGTVKDIVKETFATIEGLEKQFPAIHAKDYETAFGNIRIRLLRQRADGENQAFLTQAALFGSLDPNQPELHHAVLPLSGADVLNSLRMLKPSSFPAFFQNVTITSLQTPSEGWIIPRQFLPLNYTFKGLAIEEQGRIQRLFLPTEASQLSELEKQIPLTNSQSVRVVDINHSAFTAPLLLAPHSRLSAQLVEKSMDKARRSEDLVFEIQLSLQGVAVKGQTRLGQLKIASFKARTEYEQTPDSPPHWLYTVGKNTLLPRDSEWGEGVLLPKAFIDGGVLVGDQGYISYQSPSISTVLEQRIPIFIAGFYDPGIIPIGGKFILADQKTTSLIRSAYEQEEGPLTNGINVSFPDYRQAEQVKKEIDRALKTQDLNRYWKVETFRQYEFTKELLQQLRSDKNLSMIISSVIILVACSNIISMLVILVNDKKLEIGILRSMGASSRSIAFIFGLCGVVMGLIGSILGTLAAIGTLHHLDSLIGVIEHIQGYDLFNPTFYGSTMPNELSYEGLAFVLITTTAISVLAGVIPAVKASLMKPSSILRSE